ncbi:MAG: hypothetical protein GX926_02825, partial [Candidatus Magasanikbacteria bacterium]|nr:hypothetical protein [Candidatus Magasanikbacteria bacterium]
MKKFLQRYKVLVVVVFVFLFCIPISVEANSKYFCFYFKGDDISKKCTEDGKKVVDCPPNYIKNTDFYYPINFVGVYEPTVYGCILVPGYYVDFEITSSLFENDKNLLIEYWGSLGGQLMNNTVEGKLFKKTFIKKQLNSNIEGACCIPKDVQEVSKDIFCGQPKIKYSDKEILKLDIQDFLKNKLFANDMYIIDNGRSEFWKHVYCGVSKNDSADKYEHWNLSCTAPIPNETNRNALKNYRQDQYKVVPTNTSLINSYLFCKHPLDSTKYCACLKTNNNECFRDGSTWKTEEACNLFLEKNDNKKEYECIVCPPEEKPPAEKKVEKLEAPSTLGDLNKTKEVDLPVL